MTQTETEIKEKAKKKMETIAEKLNRLKPETVGGIALRLLCDCVPKTEEAFKLINEAESIEKSED
jgi:hypothetical protein